MNLKRKIQNNEKNLLHIKEKQLLVILMTQSFQNIRDLKLQSGNQRMLQEQPNHMLP